MSKVTESDGASEDQASEVLAADELIESGDQTAPTAGGESIEQPAKVMRVGSMVRQLLEEIRGAELDDLSRDRLAAIYDQSITELGSALSPDLHAELLRLSSPFENTATPSDGEILIAKAQLVGWLEGLIQGIQAMMFAQQAQAQAQLASMRGELPAGPTVPTPDDRPGNYL